MAGALNDSLPPAWKHCGSQSTRITAESFGTLIDCDAVANSLPIHALTGSYTSRACTPTLGDGCTGAIPAPFWRVGKTNGTRA